MALILVACSQDSEDATTVNEVQNENVKEEEIEETVEIVQEVQADEAEEVVEIEDEVEERIKYIEVNEVVTDQGIAVLIEKIKVEDGQIYIPMKWVNTSYREQTFGQLMHFYVVQGDRQLRGHEQNDDHIDQLRAHEDGAIAYFAYELLSETEPVLIHFIGMPDTIEVILQ